MRLRRLLGKARNFCSLAAVCRLYIEEMVARSTLLRSARARRVHRCKECGTGRLCSVSRSLSRAPRLSWLLAKGGQVVRQHQ